MCYPLQDTSHFSFTHLSRAPSGFTTQCRNVYATTSSNIATTIFKSLVSSIISSCAGELTSLMTQPLFRYCERRLTKDTNILIWLLISPNEDRLFFLNLHRALLNHRGEQTQELLILTECLSLIFVEKAWLKAQLISKGSLYMEHKTFWQEPCNAISCPPPNHFQHSLYIRTKCQSVCPSSQLHGHRECTAVITEPELYQAK